MRWQVNRQFVVVKDTQNTEENRVKYDEVVTGIPAVRFNVEEETCTEHPLTLATSRFVRILPQVATDAQT